MTDMTNANFPTDNEGRTYHLYLKQGEVAPRIVTVGDLGRAVAFANLPGFELKFVRVAPRLFTTLTGLYKGKPVTIITSLMGLANMDFTVRELRHVAKGPIAIVRVGTCGSPCEKTKVGQITVPHTFHTVLRMANGFRKNSQNATIDDCYSISDGIECDKGLMELLTKNCEKLCGTVYTGNHVSCCSFYSSQGRTDPNFNDKNEGLVDHMCEKLPNLVSIEMESSLLVDLAENSKVPIHAAAAHIILAQRRSQDFLTNDMKHKVEHNIGVAALETVFGYDLPGEEDIEDAVWKHQGKVLGDFDKVKEHFPNLE